MQLWSVSTCVELPEPAGPPFSTVTLWPGAAGPSGRRKKLVSFEKWSASYVRKGGGLEPQLGWELGDLGEAQRGDSLLFLMGLV